MFGLQTKLKTEEEGRTSIRNMFQQKVVSYSWIFMARYTEEKRQRRLNMFTCTMC